MVPWHLQSKYSVEKGICGGEEGEEARAARARAKKQEKRRRKGKEKGQVGVATGGEEDVPLAMKDGEGVKTRDGEIVEEASSSVVAGRGSEREQEQTHAQTGAGSQEQQLSKQGYTTYQRYYHVFKEGELVRLFHKVTQLHVKEDFYDHENWCVLAEKLNV